MNCYEEYAQTMATTQSEPVNYEEKYRLSTEQADELRRLVADLGPLNFKRSVDLSRYIVRHKLGYRYPIISGIVDMTDGTSKWKFDGGFSPDMFAIVCDALGVEDQGTHSWVIGFTPYKNTNYYPTMHTR